jgi:hypothetical protein
LHAYGRYDRHLKVTDEQRTFAVRALFLDVGRIETVF